MSKTEQERLYKLEDLPNEAADALVEQAANKIRDDWERLCAEAEDDLKGLEKGGCEWKVSNDKGKWTFEEVWIHNLDRIRQETIKWRAEHGKIQGDAEEEEVENE